MDNIKYQQLRSLADAFVSPFLKNGNRYNRIIIVSDDFEARLYVMGKMFEKLGEADGDVEIVEAERLPANFVKGKDYAIGLDYYLESRERGAVDLGDLVVV